MSPFPRCFRGSNSFSSPKGPLPSLVGTPRGPHTLINSLQLSQWNIPSVSYRPWLIHTVKAISSGRNRKTIASMTQPITPCCQVQVPVLPKIEYDLSSAAANSCLAKNLGKMREQLALQESMEPAATGVHEPPRSLLHTYAVQMQVPPFSHLKRRGTVVAGFEHYHSLKLFLTRSHRCIVRAHVHPFGWTGLCEGDLRFVLPLSQWKTLARPHTLRMCECVLVPISSMCCWSCFKSTWQSAAPEESNTYGPSEVALQAECMWCCC